MTASIESTKARTSKEQSSRALPSEMSSRTFGRLAPLLWRVPGLSERLAAQVFLMPFGKPSQVECTPPEAPETRVVINRPRTAVAHVYGEGRPVFVVHGWGGSALQMSCFVDDVVRRGYRAIAIDLPAHGESPGKQTNVLECSDVLLALGRRFGAPAGIIAHSFGAAASVLAVKRGLTVDALSLIAPLPSLDYGVAQFAARTHLPLSVMDRAVKLIEAELGLERRDIELTNVGPELHTPLLCIHDQGDGVISVEASRRVCKAWPEARLMETHGLGHRRILREPSVVRSAVAFLEQGLRERPIDLDRALACA